MVGRETVQFCGIALSTVLSADGADAYVQCCNGFQRTCMVSVLLVLDCTLCYDWGGIVNSHNQPCRDIEKARISINTMQFLLIA